MPGGASVTYAPFMFHRQSTIWGEDAHEFKPDRWLNGDAALGRRAGAYMPFSAGPRIVRRSALRSLPGDLRGMKCLGQQLAYTVISYVMVRLVSEFAFNQASDKQPADSRPPREWRMPPQRVARKLIEKVWPQASFTLGIKVSAFPDA